SATKRSFSWSVQSLPAEPEPVASILTPLPKARMRRPELKPVYPKSDYLDIYSIDPATSLRPRPRARRRGHRPSRRARRRSVIDCLRAILRERNANSRTTLKGRRRRRCSHSIKTKANALRVFLAALHFIKVSRQR